MDVTDKTRLLDEFRHYLETLETPVPAEGRPETDLYSLFSELAALRTEVRTESRLFRSSLDDLRDVQGWLRNAQTAQGETLDRFRGELDGLRQAALRPLLLDLLDVHDRLSAGLAALRAYRPVKGWFRIKSRREDRRFIDSVGEGQGMTLRRLEELLARQQVWPMEVLGKPVDPYTMKVVELDREPGGGRESGIVTAELRKGFRWGDGVLRLAEVRALP